MAAYPKNPDPKAPAPMPDLEAVSRMLNRMYPGLQMLARDVDLPEGLAEKYTPGQIILERAFTDASARFMGMVTTHRYVILSNHMANMGDSSGWGLHTAACYSHFKVLGQCTHQGKTGIFLLHLPNDDTWKFHKTMEFSINKTLLESAMERFRVKCLSAPVPELCTPEWQERCRFPVGMDSQGNFWPIDQEIPKWLQDQRS